MKSAMNIIDAGLRDQLATRADLADRVREWPNGSWQILHDMGALGWSVPTRFGGSELGGRDRLRGMEEIASSCLTTAFILSQREAAVRQLLKGPVSLQERYLPASASSEIFLTVGLSQLTTSRQHSGPSLRATPTSTGGYRLDGEIPWVTGADQAAAIVVGATLEDGTQLMIVLPANSSGVRIEPPLPLTALAGSRTSLIRCDGVHIGSDLVLAGPVENVLGKIGGGGLDTSCLAIGLAAAALKFIQLESATRPDLANAAKSFADAIQKARETLYALADVESAPERTLALRVESTKLALRATQAALMVAKGAGFLVPHPTQLWARQAMFFLVWSCPRPVTEGVMEDLLGV